MLMYTRVRFPERGRHPKFRRPSVVAGRIATCRACAQSTHRRCSSASETCQLKPFAYPAKAQYLPEHKARSLLAHLRIPVSKRLANVDAEAHSSHPERSRCIRSWSFRMSSRYTLISCWRTSDCNGGGWTRFRVLRSSKALERRQRILAGKYILAACLIRL